MTYFLMDPIGAAGTATQCPGCGSAQTVWVDTGVQDNLLCKTCGSCWHEVERHNERVQVQSCPGCEHRDVCLAARG